MSAQRLQYITLDVFTQNRYEGNPLAIVRVPASIVLAQEQKLRIAKEFNYSETVFLHESEESFRKSEWKIDIFLTTGEIPLAGHPVIGTAYYLGTTLQTTGAAGSIVGTLITKAGRVPFTYDTHQKKASLQIPHDVHLHQKSLTTEEIAQLGLPEGTYKGGEAPVVSIVKGMTFCLFQLPSLEALASIKPNLKLIDRNGLNPQYLANGTVGYFFYVKQETHVDEVAKLRTRMMLGTLEDPATGSASSALACYLAFHEPGRQSRDNGIYRYELTQGVEMGRKSVIELEIVGNEASQKVEKVTLSGSAIDVMEGALITPA